MAKWWKRRKRSEAAETSKEPLVRPPLREFVYLDDVSLRSLLASQKGELTEQVTDMLSQADEAELAGSIGATTPVIKSEIRSRYQTSTSHGTQTARKAVSQSLFKELRELDWIDVAIQPNRNPGTAESLNQLLASDRAVAALELRRGSLVEIEVELVADPIFRFSTIASELTELAHDFPEMLDHSDAREGMAKLVPGNRFLQRFLAGLVPVRATATSHVVVESDGAEFVVPASDALALGLKARPLVIVGVTEQSSYWRDVRRVLFARSQFTMLCRVGRNGLSDSWEPVKLSEVLKEVLPTFPGLIADVGRTGLSLTSSMPAQVEPLAIAGALNCFVDYVEASSPPGLTTEGLAAARAVIAVSAAELPMNLTDQNGAFRLVVAELQEHGCNWTGDEWLNLQMQARESAGLALFEEQNSTVVAPESSIGSEPTEERLLDTEVIAIYW